MSQNQSSNPFDTKQTYLNINKSLEFVGHSSYYQKRVLVIFAIQWMIFSFLIMGYPFLFQEPKFICQDGELCIESVYCATPENKRSISKKSVESITLQYNLVCENSTYIGLIGSIFFFGSVISGFIAPVLAQKKGRKFTILLCILFAGVSLIVAAVVDNLSVLITCFFISGVGTYGFETLSLVYIAEITGNKFLANTSTGLTVAWGLGQIIFSGLNIFVTSYKYILIYMMGIPFLLSVFIANRLIHESPRWYYVKQQYQNAKIVLNKISLTNDRPRFDYKLEGEENQDLYENPQKKRSQENNPRNSIKHQKTNYTYIDVFRYRSIRNITFLLFILWLFRYVTYYGQAFSLENLGEEMRFNITLFAMAEIIACLFSVMIKTKVQRRSSMMVFAAITSGCCVGMTYLVVPAWCVTADATCVEEVSRRVLAVVIRFSIVIYTELLLTYTQEIYPTVVKALGYGICMTFGRIGLMVMPFIVQTAMLKDYNPLEIFGYLGLIVTIACYFLKETFNQKITDFIEENKQTERPLIDVSDLNRALLFGDIEK